MKWVSIVIKNLKMPALFIFFAYVVLSACYNLGGADYLFHTKMGEYIVSHKAVPDQDVFSFTMPGKRWVDHEWLYQILVYNLHRYFGLEGFFTLRMIIFSLIFFILAAMVMKANWVFGFPLLVYGLQLSLGRFTMRPDNFSLLFVTLFLMPFVFKKKKMLIFLPLVQLFWVNIHGFFFLGPLILGFYLLLSRFNQNKEDQDFYRRAKFIFILSILACFLNPNPLATITYPFKIISDIFSGEQSLFYKHIQELASPLDHIWMYRYYFGYVIFTFVILCFLKNLDWFYLGLGIFMLIFSLNSLRNTYFFMPVAIAIFVNRYPVIKDIALRRIFQAKGLILLEVLFLIYAGFLSWPMVKKIQNFPKLGIAYVDEQGVFKKDSIFFLRNPIAYPQEMIDFIASHHLPEKMFNTFNIGAMMIYNFYPQRQVFIDGRGELYGQKFFAQYQSVLEADEAVLDKIINKYKIEGFILTYLRDSPPPLMNLLRKRGFECVYFGHKGIIFVSPNFFNKNPKLKQERINFSALRVKKLDLLKEVKLEKPYLEGYFNMARVLYILEYYQKSQEYLNEILRVAPNHAESYHLLGLISYEQKNYDAAFTLCRSSLLFNDSKKANLLLAKLYLKTGNQSAAEKVVKALKMDFIKFKSEVDDE